MGQICNLPSPLGRIWQITNLPHGRLQIRCHGRPKDPKSASMFEACMYPLETEYLSCPFDNTT